MGSQEKHIELRISHRGSPYVAVLGGRSPEYGFERIFNPFHRRCVRLLDGRQDVYKRQALNATWPPHGASAYGAV